MKRPISLIAMIVGLLGVSDQAGEKKKLALAEIYGRIEFVESVPDYKVKAVRTFPDLKVKIVKSLPGPGEWEIVESFPDFKIQMVKTFPDFTVEFEDGTPPAAK